ncbi:MAG: hypothetical protein SGCHY_002297 [Lobulomycetales sp.]
MTAPELSINPVKGRSLLQGYLGITSTVSFRGTIDFTTPRQLNVRSLTLALDGFYRTTLTIGKKQHEEKLNFLYRSSILIDSTVPLYTDRVDQKHNVVVLPPGKHSIPFSIDIPEDVCKDLPASFFTEPVENEDSATVRYELTATLNVLPAAWMSTPFDGKVKTQSCMELVDVARIQSDILLDQSTSQTLLKNEDSTMDYKILVSNIKFGAEKPILLTIEELVVHYCHVLKDIEVAIKQHEVLRCSGHQKTYTPSIAVPAKTLKYKKTWHAGSYIVKNVECTLALPADAKAQKKFKTVPHQALDSPLLTVFHVLEVKVRLNDGREVKIEAPVIFSEASRQAQKMVERAEGNLVEFQE